ncbi:MAG: iron chaperone [Rudaea sp.]
MAVKKSSKSSKGFTSEERAAMKDRVRELKSAGGEGEVLAAIARMPEPNRAMATRLHAIITANAPTLSPKTWYGMPAYANGDKVVCFFQGSHKFKTRYATLGFSDKAKLDDGAMWPTAFALTKLSAAEEARIVALINKAVG